MKANKSFAIIATVLLSAASISITTSANAATDSQGRLSTETQQFCHRIFWSC